MLDKQEARKRELPGHQPSNVQSRPPRVGSAPIPHNPPMNYQPTLGSRPANQMLGISQQGYADSSQGPFQHPMFAQRPIPRTQSPMAMSTSGYFAGASRPDGSFQPRPLMFHNTQQDKFETLEQQGQIDEIESNSLSSDEQPQHNPGRAADSRGANAMFNNIMGIREMINEDEYITEKNSRDNQSGGGSGKLGSQRLRPPQPSQHLRGQMQQKPSAPLQPPQPAPLSGYQQYEGFGHDGEYGADNHHDPYSNYVDDPNEGYYQPTYEKGTREYYEQDYYAYDNYEEAAGGQQPYQQSKDSKRAGQGQPYGKQPSKGKVKNPRNKTRSSRDRENTETYEPPAGRNTTGSHHKNKNLYGDKHSSHNLTHEWNKQQGSRYIQYLLSSQDKEEANILVRELIPQIVDISLNIFGNYVAQKMIEVGRLV